MAFAPPQTPLCTVDTIIHLVEHPLYRADRPAIVLIERKHAPLGWALPGGFVDVGESVADAARREALEETSLEVELLEQFYCYSQPARDPRRHTVSTVYIGKARGAPKAADDAKNLGVFTAEDLPQLAFDHGQILADYFEYLRTGRRPPPSR
jgi:8-oxo-dGTP diphosphatase